MIPYLRQKLDTELPEWVHDIVECRVPATLVLVVVQGSQPRFANEGHGVVQYFARLPTLLMYLETRALNIVSCGVRGGLWGATKLVVWLPRRRCRCMTSFEGK